jgi:hypothetical protein
MLRRPARVVLLAGLATGCGPRDHGFDDGLTLTGLDSSSSSLGSSASADDSADTSDSSGPASAGSAEGGSSSTGAGFVPFAIELPDDKVPYCVTAGETLLDFIVPGSGDGTAIACAHESGIGEGSLPSKVSIDSTTCEIVGEPPTDRYGTWAVIVKATQSGVDAWVPYCITQDRSPAGSATIEVLTDASGATDAALVPLRGTFSVDGPFSAGAPGDPIVSIIDTDACSADGCEYGFSYFVSVSPFDESHFAVVDDMVLDIDGVPAGMAHGLELVGPADADDVEDLAPFAARPWVVGLSVDYCLAAEPDVCVADRIFANAVARFQYSVVMTPE